MLWWTLRQIRSADLRVRAKALQRLKATGDTPRAVHALSKSRSADVLVWLFQNELDSGIQRSIASALRNLGAEPAIAHAVNAIVERCDNYKLSQKEREAVAAPIIDLGECAIEPLMAAFAKNERKFGVIVALGGIKDERAVSALMAELQNARRLPGNTFSIAAARSLGRTGTADAVRLLVHALGASDEAVRTAAADALGTSGDRSAVQPLLQATADAALSVRLQAAASLIVLEAPLPSESLVSLLLEFVRSFEKQHSVDAAGEVKSNEAAGVIAVQLSIPAETVVAGVEALGSQIRYSKDNYDPKYGGDRLTVESGLAALRRVCGTVGPFTTGILRLIAERPDVTVTLHHDCQPACNSKLDFSQWRQLARQELIRRGFDA